MSIILEYCFVGFCYGMVGLLPIFYLALVVALIFD